MSVGDVLRMLAMLTEAETSIRRSANARLVVETLLLRWTLMDRTIDLAEVLRGQPRVARGTEEPRPAPRAVEPVAAAARPGGSEPAMAGYFEGPLSLANLKASWVAVVGLARARGPLLGTVIEGLTPVGVEDRVVTLEVGPDALHLAEGAKRQLAAIGELLAGAAGDPVVVRLLEPGARSTQTDRLKRLSDSDLRNERLKAIRAKDHALDAAAAALDLEIVE